MNRQNPDVQNLDARVSGFQTEFFWYYIKRSRLVENLDFRQMGPYLLGPDQSRFRHSTYFNILKPNTSSVKVKSDRDHSQTFQLFFLPFLLFLTLQIFAVFSLLVSKAETDVTTVSKLDV